MEPDDIWYNSQHRIQLVPEAKNKTKIPKLKKDTKPNILIFTSDQ